MKKYVIQAWNGPDMDKIWEDQENHPFPHPDDQDPIYFDWVTRLIRLKECYPNTIFQCVVREDTPLYVTK